VTSLEDRFEAKVDRSGDHHLWTGSKKADGTGKLKVEGRVVTAHRVAWELANGPPTGGTRPLVPGREGLRSGGAPVGGGGALVGDPDPPEAGLSGL
jgi:hypothetical protein